MHRRRLVALPHLAVDQLDEVHEEQGELGRHIRAVVEVLIIDLVQPLIEFLLDDVRQQVRVFGLGSRFHLTHSSSSEVRRWAATSMVFIRPVWIASLWF